MSALDAARQSGYSDDEIFDYLSKKYAGSASKIEAAKKHGYSLDEIYSRLENPSEEKEPSGVLSTAKETLAKGGAEIAALPKAVLDILRIHGPRILKEPGSLADVAASKLPEYEEALDWLRNFLGSKEQEEGAGKIISDIGGAGVAGLPFGPGGAAAGLASEAAVQGAKALDLPEVVQKGVGIGAGLLTAAGRRKAATTALERSVAHNAEKKALLEYGKSKGLTEKQLTPALQSETKSQLLGKLGKHGKGAQAAFEESKTALGDLRQSLVERGKAKGALDPILKQEFSKDLEKVRDGLAHTVKASSEKEKAIAYLDEAIKNSYNQPQDAGKLINFLKDVNEEVNWNVLGEGKKGLAEAKAAALKAIKKTDPRLAHEVENFNTLYENVSKTQKALGHPKIIENVLKSGEAGALLYHAANINPTGVATVLKGIGSIEAARWLTTQFLINPRFQALHKTLVNALVHNKRKVAVTVLHQLKKETQNEFPDLEIEWPEFED